MPDHHLPQATHWCDPIAIDFDVLAEENGTPFYLYDVDTVVARIERVRSSFSGLANVYYAVKTNPNLELLKSLARHVDGLDISSGGEFEQTRVAGYEAKKLSFAGPAKTVTELSTSIENGIGSISVESERELEDIVSISKRMGLRANIVLRVNPVEMVREFGMKMGGRPIQFGVDEERLVEVAQIVCRNEQYLNFRGLHVYAGSQCFDEEAVAAGVQNTLRIVEALESAVPLRCQTVNLGGGFGVSHTGDGRELDAAKLGHLLLPTLREISTNSGEPRKIIFELGRYLMADAGVYVVRVIDRKTSRGKRFALVDGGLHHHLAAGGMFGTGLRSNYMLMNLSNPGGDIEKCNIAGPSCNPSDLLGVNVELPQPRIGDLLCVMKSGSYAFSASPLLFLGRPTPVELVRESGVVRRGRSAYVVTDFN